MNIKISLYQPGRVATLIEDPKGSVCGLGFELSPEEAEATFTYLDDRETGYKLKEVVFYPCDPSQLPQKVSNQSCTVPNVFYYCIFISILT